ncbi:MAG: hypothetical protein U5L09_08155 [Bacteroidales bacterium]|nr:hypothetical protein [Bacteroidales bacterium]
MKIERLFDLQDHILQHFPEKDDVFAGKENGSWQKISARQYREISIQLANALIHQGIVPGDKIATHFR